MSRQPLHPCRKDAWVRQSVEVVDWLRQHNHTIISSVGSQTWELLTALASDRQIPMVLILPAKDRPAFDSAVHSVIDEFELESKSVKFLPLFTANMRTREEAMKARDRDVIERADSIIPVSLRPKSGLEKLISAEAAKGKKIIDDFRVPYQKRKNPLSYKIGPDNLNPDLTNVTERYLIHWTRSFHHKWPGEKQIDYYRSIVRSDRYPRCAIDTLIRMLTTRTIHASSRHIPAGHTCVSFSSLSPQDLLPLVTWRARYRQMAFEPYGVGIRRDLADSLDIHPVHYGPCPDKDAPRWLLQSAGRITDWRREREHRHPGDFDLSDISSDKLIAFCLTPAEASRVQNLTGIRTIPFTR